ncbi:MAG: type II toxin-antitoxin system HipA family toxin, partial [Marinobacter sp.]
MTQKIKTLDVSVSGKLVGELQKHSQFCFAYDTSADEAQSVSLTMPVRSSEFRRSTLHPVFEMNLPEGYLRQRIIERFRKHATVDEMFFLALQGDRSIGRLGFQSKGVTRKTVEGTSLQTLVKAHNPELFEQLVDRYLEQTTIAGVQPKVLVPESTEPKSAIFLPELIVKAAGPEFPDLTVNEFVCMSIAREAGLAVPEFHLSENARLFIMCRFDIGADSERLGMEDICGLMGLVAEDKYRRSYEQVAKAVGIYSDQPNRDLEILFRSLCVSVLVGNGDAHLKNFAMLYRDASAGKAWLSPAYDIVNTTVYLEADTLALKLGRTKDFPNRNTMVRFGREHCNLTAKMAESVIDDCIRAVEWGIEELSGFAEAVEFEGRTVLSELKKGVGRLMKAERKHLSLTRTRQFALRTRPPQQTPTIPRFPTQRHGYN